MSALFSCAPLDTLLSTLGVAGDTQRAEKVTGKERAPVEEATGVAARMERELEVAREPMRIELCLLLLLLVTCDAGFAAAEDEGSDDVDDAAADDVTCALLLAASTRVTAGEESDVESVCLSGKLRRRTFAAGDVENTDGLTATRATDTSYFKHILVCP